MACLTLTSRSARLGPSMKAIVGIVALGFCSCAAASSTPRARPETAAASPRPVQLTGAVLSAPIEEPPPASLAPPPAPKPRWTDAEILAAVAAAQTNQYSEARTARARSHSVRVERFASDLVTDDRELEHARRVLPYQDAPAPSELLVEVQEARGEVADALRAASPGSFDCDFIAAEIRYQRALGQIVQDEMIPNATSPELKQFLQDLKAKTMRARLVAEQVESYLH